MKQILKYFPISISDNIIDVLERNKNLEYEVEEIRLRVLRPIILKTRKRDIILKRNIESFEILEILEKVCENSMYAYRNQLCNGFITVKGGHRIGILGTAVENDGNIINVKYINSLNFRIAREILNCSDKILPQIIDIKNQTIYTTLIVSPPGKGKTTILRDIIRQLSNGISSLQFKGKNCGVVDERGEIAAMYKGIPQNQIGIRTDVIENISKEKGMNMLIRSMAPEIIACDEIGTKEDVQAIKKAIISGVKGIFTMHGKTMNDIENNKEINELVKNKLIEKIIFI